MRCVYRGVNKTCRLQYFPYSLNFAEDAHEGRPTDKLYADLELYLIFRYKEMNSRLSAALISLSLT